MNFEYYKASSIKNAIDLLKEMDDKGKIIAGGTDLLINMKKGKYSPEAIVDITSIPGMDQIKFIKDDGLKIGAAVTNANMCKTSQKIQSKYTALVEACSQLGSPQIRNLSTIGGNICNASPSAETAPALIALGGYVKIENESESKILRIEDFFKGPCQNAMNNHEVMSEINLTTNHNFSCGSAYVRLSTRNALDIAVVNVGVFLAMENDKFKEVRICLGAVAPTPIRPFDAEELLLEDGFNDQTVKRACELAKSYANPISDVRASAEYRSEMVEIITEKALRSAYNRCKTNLNSKGGKKFENKN